MTIYFYKTNEKYGCFSNFAHYGFELDEKWWMTSEHYFQAQKFYGTEYVEIIRLLDNPMKAAKMGRNRNLPLREDWEEVKDNVIGRQYMLNFLIHIHPLELCFVDSQSLSCKKSNLAELG